MARIEPLEPPYEPPLAEALAAMMPPGAAPLKLFRSLAHNPRVLRKIGAGNLLDRGSLDRRDRELAILRTTARCGSEYEWGVHVTFFARRFGIDDEQIAGTLHWDGEDARWAPGEAAIVRLVDELHASARVSDALWQELRGRFDQAQLIELVVLVGFYHSISFVTNALDIEREEGAERFPSVKARRRASRPPP